MYSYDVERPRLFTDDGQRLFLKVRDQVQQLLKDSGAVRYQEAIRNMTGDSWQMLACLDRLIELGELRKLDQGNVAGQYEVYVSAH